MVFNFLPKKKNQPKLGIDISSSAVKLLEISFDQGVYCVESYAVEPLPPGLVVEKTITDVEILGNIIRQAVKKSGTSVKEAITSVANSAVITKLLPMDAVLTDEEIESQIRVEADQYIPYPLSEVSLDFEILGPAEDLPDKVDILLTACRAEAVELRADALDIGGLIAKIVDVESYAIERACRLMVDHIPGGLHQTIAVMDIGASITTLTVLNEGKTVYTREQIFGGRQLTEEIQRRYRLSFEEAGFAKKRGGLPEDYESEVLPHYLDAVVQQIIRCLQFFFSSSQYNHVDRIILAGGTASIAGLRQMVEDKVGAPTTVADPLVDVAVSPGISPAKLYEDAPALMVAIGLALRSFE